MWHCIIKWWQEFMNQSTNKKDSFHVGNLSPPPLQKSPLQLKRPPMKEMNALDRSCNSCYLSDDNPLSLTSNALWQRHSSQQNRWKVHFLLWSKSMLDIIFSLPMAKKWNWKRNFCNLKSKQVSAPGCGRSWNKQHFCKFCLKTA